MVGGAIHFLSADTRSTAVGNKLESLETLQKFLPPAGRLILVHNPEGQLVGCGTLQQVRPYAGEVKRLKKELQRLRKHYKVPTSD